VCLANCNFARVVRKNSIRLPSDRDVGIYLFWLRGARKPEKPALPGRKHFSAGLTVCDPDSPCLDSFRAQKRSLDSLLNSITDLAGDGLIFFRLLLRSRTSLSAEVLFLRKQLTFYEERQVQPRRWNDSARFSLILWSRLCNWKEALVIVKPGTLIGWHRKGFQLFWKWKSQARRPRLPENIRKLIVQMAQENPTWGQARVAAELSVKLVSMFLRARCAPIGLPNRSHEAVGGPLRRTGGRLSAITPGPSSPAISWS